MGDRFKVRRCLVKMWVETRKGMLGRETKVESAAWADIDGLAAELENTYNGFDDEGYDVVNVVPVLSLIHI